MLRGYLFTGVYYILSVVYVLVSLPFLALPGRGPVTLIIRSYTRAINLALRLICGVKKEVRGQDRLPEGAFIIAAKHSSWGDGFLIYPEVKNLGFVTGDHLEKFPLVGGILKKLGAIVIDTCGGGERKAISLAEGMSRARKEGRRILIYPEGHLAPAGYHFRYKPGVWHMQKAMNVPIVPVATNLSCFWEQEDIAKTPGTAIIEFLDPILPGRPKEDVMAEITERVEQRSSELIAEARGVSAEPSILLADPDKGTLGRPDIRPPEGVTN